MVTPAVSPHRRVEKYVPPRRLSTAVHPTLARSTPVPSLPPSEQFFAKRLVVPGSQHSKLSALSQALASTSGSSSNPFSETYAAISGRGESASVNIPVYFPRARNPAGKPLNLNVRRDSTIEEVLGFALWSYWEKGWLPTLSEGVTDERDPKLSAVGWILRLAEDDGEVDDDFPGAFSLSWPWSFYLTANLAPDRSMPASKFAADAYAVLEANPAQSKCSSPRKESKGDLLSTPVSQNQLLQSKIQRRPSRTVGTTSVSKPIEAKPTMATLSLPALGFASSSVVSGSAPLSTSIGPSSSHGPQLFLRIRIAESADDIHVSTTIPV